MTTPAAPAATDWLPLFTEFVAHLRIPSKDVAWYDPSDHGVPLHLWGSQKLYMRELASGLRKGVRTFFFLKNRQAGISTISLALDLFWLAWFPGTQAVLVVDTEGNRAKFRHLLKLYLASFPAGFFGRAFAVVKGRDNRDFMHFTNGSTLDFLVAGMAKGSNRKKTLGESRGYSYAHLSEVANYGSHEGLQSFRETLSEKHPDRIFIFESTAKGFNHWHEMYTEGLRDTITKKSVFIGWWAREDNALRPKGPPPEPRLYATYGLSPPTPDEREKIRIVLERHGHQITQSQLAWYRWRESDTSTTADDLRQNQPWYAEEAFVLTGASFFQVRLLQKHLSRLFEYVGEDGLKGYPFSGYRFYLANNFLHSKMEQVSRAQDAELRVWEEPARGGTYVIGCDGAWGRHGDRDSTAISVWRCYADMLVQVAEYDANTVDTRQAAWVLAYLAGAYRDCVLNIEISGGSGLAILSEFKSLRLLLQAQAFPETKRDSQWEDFLSQARWFIYRRYDSLQASAGLTQWSTTRQNKFEIMNQLRDSLAKEELWPHSVPLLEQMTHVIQSESSIEAPGRNHDDRCFAAALANRAWIDSVRPGMIAANATFEAVQKAETAAPPTGIEDMANRMVRQFFERAREKAMEGPQPPKWMRERGLV